jgi:hypothetical protein
LNQKFRQNEIRELCELRQLKSSCLLSLHEILSLPLERIIYYKDFENKLIESYDQSSINEIRHLNTNTNKYYIESSIEETLSIDKYTATFKETKIDRDIENYSEFSLNRNRESKSAQNSIGNLEDLKNQNSLLLRNKSVGDILSENNDCMTDSWKKMKDKSESIIISFCLFLLKAHS